MAISLALRSGPAAAMGHRSVNKSALLKLRPAAAPQPARRRVVQTRAQGEEGLGRAMAAEFTGSALFQLVGAAAAAGGFGAAVATNSLGLAALICAFANVSGGHLNPAVSFMLMLRGKISQAKFFAYAAAQIAGCVLGATLLAYLIPGVALGMGGAAPGAWAPAAGLSSAAIFGWECLMTAFLCLTVWGSAVAKPGLGNTAPLAIGFSVLASALACGTLTGSVINPARALGPALVFGNLGAGVVALYLAAQFAGAALAAAVGGALYPADA